MITSTLLFSLHIGISYYKHYSFVSGYNQVMEKHKQTFVTDETILTILSPYFLLLLLENIVSSILLDLPIVLLLTISLLIVGGLYYKKPSPIVSISSSSSNSSSNSFQILYSIISNLVIDSLFISLLLIESSGNFYKILIAIMYIIVAFGLVKTLSYTIYYSHTQLLVKLAQFFIPIRINSEIRQIAHDLYKFDFNSLIAYVMTLLSIVVILLPLSAGGHELKGKLIILFGTSLLQLVHLPQIQNYLQAIPLDQFVKSKLTNVIGGEHSTTSTQPTITQKTIVSNIPLTSVKEKAKLFESNKEPTQAAVVAEKKPIIVVQKPTEKPVTTITQPKVQPKEVVKSTPTITKEQPTIVKPSIVAAAESKKPVEKPTASLKNLPTSQPEISKPIIPKETVAIPKVQPKEDAKLTITPAVATPAIEPSTNVSGGVIISKLNLSQLSNIPPSTDNATSAETLSSRDSSRDENGSLSARRSGSFANIMKNVQSPRDGSLNSPRNLDGMTTPRGTAIQSPRNSMNFSQIAERMKQKLNLKPKVEVTAPVNETTTSTSQLGQVVKKLHESPNTMDKFKKVKMGQPRKERSRANVKQLLNVVQESNENLIELPKQDDFEKLEQASKSEKKFGLANPIQFRLPPQPSILSTASSTAGSSSSDVEEKEEKKVNLDKIIGKSKQQQGMGGIDLQSVLNARNKLKKTGEELK